MRVMHDLVYLGIGERAVVLYMLILPVGSVFSMKPHLQLPTSEIHNRLISRKRVGCGESVGPPL